MVLAEMTTAEIADQLNISRRTVDAHRRSITNKSEARNLISLYKFALSNNLITNK
jgi:DNA-binding CsgD family transcriptional regulator